MKHQGQIWRPWSLFLFAFVLMVMATNATAGEPANGSAKELAPAVTEQATSQAPAAQYQPVNMGGVRVFVDPQTGELRPPTEEEAQELLKALREKYGTPRHKKSQEREMVIAKDGTMSMVLDQDLFNYSVVVANPDGTYTFQCAKGMDQAVQLLKTAPDKHAKAKIEEE